MGEGVRGRQTFVACACCAQTSSADTGAMDRRTKPLSTFFASEVRKRGLFDDPAVHASGPSRRAAGPDSGTACLWLCSVATSPKSASRSPVARAAEQQQAQRTRPAP